MGSQAETKDITAEELVAVLKFTPRTYKISLWGYGGEKVMGTTTREVWDYCNENQVNLTDLAWDSDAAEEMGLDEEKLPFPPGSWYECDNLAHANGVSLDSGTVQIEDENGEVVFERPLEDCMDEDGNEANFEWISDASIYGHEEGSVLFVGSSNEKGTFFEGDIELTAPFDIRKLKLIGEVIDGEDIITGVEYDGEDIDNYGGDTNGKSSDYDMYLVGKDDEIERYAPEDKDWGEPYCGSSPDEWESVKFKFKKAKPVHVGWYSCNYSYGSTYGSLYWDGENFGEFEYGKFHTKDQKGIVSWTGYNWNTSDWANRPPEPPSISCDNKKCGWVGNGEDRITDDEDNDHCPDCNGTEFSWMDYDPDTAKGRKNREKYCTTNPAGKPAPSPVSIEEMLKRAKQEAGIEE
mgnify:CR=1 FL=1